MATAGDIALLDALCKSDERSATKTGADVQITVCNKGNRRITVVLLKYRLTSTREVIVDDATALLEEWIALCIARSKSGKVFAWPDNCEQQVIKFCPR